MKAFLPKWWLCLLLIPSLCVAQECRKPRKPELAAERFDALRKRAAYASFIADSCGIPNDLQQEFSALVKSAFPEDVEQQSSATAKFRKFKQAFADDAGMLGIFKRCYLQGGKTRGFVAEVSEDIALFSDAIAAAAKKYGGELEQWDACEQRRREEEARRREEEAREEARRAEEAKQAEALALQQQYLQSEEYARRKAAYDVNARFRSSLFHEGTFVLVMDNPSARTADFLLRCYQTNGSSKSFRFAIAPGQTQELGFNQGWPGNFVRGEYCLAYYGDDQLWRVEKK
jgi:hypothetical protein